MNLNPFNKVELTLQATKGGKVVSSREGLEGDDVSKKILLDYLDAMINGSPISQISSYKNMSDYAKRALVELQNSTLGDETKKKQEELKELSIEVQKLQETKEKLAPLVDTLKDNKDSLDSQIADLTGLLKELREEFEKLQSEKMSVEEVLQDLKTTGEDKVNQELDELRQSGLDKVSKELNEKKQKELADMKRTFAILRDTGIEKVNSEVDAYEKMRKDEIKRLEDRVKELQLLIKKIETQYNDLIRKADKLITDNYSKSKENLSSGIIHDVNIMRRESYLQVVALESVAKQQIIQRQLDKVIQLLIPLLPKDVNLEEYLNQNVFDESISKKA